MTLLKGPGCISPASASNICFDAGVSVHDFCVIAILVSDRRLSHRLCVARRAPASTRYRSSCGSSTRSFDAPLAGRNGRDDGGYACWERQISHEARHPHRFHQIPARRLGLTAGEAGAVAPYDSAVLAHDERHLRRRAIETARSERVLVDLPEPVARTMATGWCWRMAVISRSSRPKNRSTTSVPRAPCTWPSLPGISAIATWLPPIEADRILILRDHVIKAMLEGLGATVSDVSEPFKPRARRLFRARSRSCPCRGACAQRFAFPCP